MSEKKEPVKPVETKKEAPKVEPKKDPQKSMMNLTLKELDTLKIQFSNLFAIGNVSMNLSWTQIITMINYLKKEDIIDWSTTLEQALKIIPDFLQ